METNLTLFVCHVAVNRGEREAHNTRLTGRSCAACHATKRWDRKGIHPFFHALYIPLRPRPHSVLPQQPHFVPATLGMWSTLRSSCATATSRASYLRRGPSRAPTRAWQGAAGSNSESGGAGLCPCALHSGVQDAKPCQTDECGLGLATAKRPVNRPVHRGEFLALTGWWLSGGDLPGQPRKGLQQQPDPWAQLINMSSFLPSKGHGACKRKVRDRTGAIHLLLARAMGVLTSLSITFICCVVHERQSSPPFLRASMALSMHTISIGSLHFGPGFLAVRFMSHPQL